MTAAAIRRVIPLLSPFEMANANAGELVARMRGGGYADELRKIFGEAIFDRQREGFCSASVRRSKFSRKIIARFIPTAANTTVYLAGRAALTEQEARGLALFNDPEKAIAAIVIAARAARTARRRNLPIMA